MEAIDPAYFVFYSKKASWRVAYEKINLLEVGQNASHSAILAVLAPSLFLFSKRHKHFLTVGYQDDEGRQQAMVFLINKGDFRVMLASLEARTGRRIEYEDDEASRAGKG